MLLTEPEQQREGVQNGQGTPREPVMSKQGTDQEPFRFKKTILILLAQGQLHWEFQADSTSKALTELLPHRKGGRFRSMNEGVRPTPADRAPPKCHITSLSLHIPWDRKGKQRAPQHRPTGLGWNSTDFLSSACWPESAGCRLTRGKLERKTLITSVL